MRGGRARLLAAAKWRREREQLGEIHLPLPMLLLTSSPSRGGDEQGGGQGSETQAWGGVAWGGPLSLEVLLKNLMSSGY